MASEIGFGKAAGGAAELSRRRWRFSRWTIGNAGERATELCVVRRKQASAMGPDQELIRMRMASGAFLLMSRLSMMNWAFAFTTSQADL